MLIVQPSVRICPRLYGQGFNGLVECTSISALSNGVQYDSWQDVPSPHYGDGDVDFSNTLVNPL